MGSKTAGKGGDIMEKLNEIRASEVTQVVRRTLPLNYLETVSCLRLSGEDSSGKPAEIVFFSRTGMARLRDLTGGGADSDPCGGHSGH